MSATCFLLLDTGEKEITKRLENKQAAINWLLTMSENPRFLYGYTGDQTIGFCIAKQ